MGLNLDDDDDDEIGLNVEDEVIDDGPVISEEPEVVVDEPVILEESVDKKEHDLEESVIVEEETSDEPVTKDTKDKIEEDDGPVILENKA